MVKINREKADRDFLGIKNENWMAAARDLRAHALMLYLYLASNANNFNLALSPAAIQEAIGMPASTYRDQLRLLISKGYLVQTGSNTFAFFEKPQPRVAQPDLNAVTATGYSFEDSAITAYPTTDAVNAGTPEDREINNIQILVDKLGINNSDVGAIEGFIPAPREKEREGAADRQREFIF